MQKSYFLKYLIIKKIHQLINNMSHLGTDHFSTEINFPFRTSCLVLPWCQLCFQLKFQYLCVLNRTPLKSKMSKTKNSSYHQVHPNITHFRNTSKFAIFLEFENHWFLFPRVNLTKFKHRNTAAQKRKR